MKALKKNKKNGMRKKTWEKRKHLNIKEKNINKIYILVDTKKVERSKNSLCISVLS